MKIMAIDLGDSKTGLACCDELETLAYPVATIAEKCMKTLTTKIIEKINELKIEMAVVGKPINMDGSCGARCKKCEKFADNLQKNVKIPVLLWDERQTTLMAQRLMIDSCTKKNKKKSLVDQVAATIILQNFLTFRKNNS